MSALPRLSADSNDQARSIIRADQQIFIAIAEVQGRALTPWGSSSSRAKPDDSAEAPSLFAAETARLQHRGRHRVTLPAAS